MLHISILSLHRLFIGIGIAVPTIVIILLIILCCILYFIYAQYRRNKLQALLLSCQRSQCNRSDSTMALTISHGDTPPTTQDATPTKNVATNESVAAQSGESTEVPLEDVSLISIWQQSKWILDLHKKLIVILCHAKCYIIVLLIHCLFKIDSFLTSDCIVLWSVCVQS